MPAVPHAPHPALLRGERITKQFGSRTLFSDLELSVSVGNSLAILGESGTGKSTLLHILAGLEPPDDGRIMIKGIDPWALNGRERNRLRRQQIGLVFQAFYLLPHLSARHNIALPWLLDGQPPDNKRIDELLDKIGLSHRADARPAELSGGEQQRVAIARALALKPSLILADEPTGNLDARNAALVLDLLLTQTAESRHALIMVTHSQKAAAQMQRQVRLENGQLQEHRST